MPTSTSESLSAIPTTAFFRLLRQPDVDHGGGGKEATALREFLATLRRCPESDLGQHLSQLYSKCLASADLAFLGLVFSCRVLDVALPGSPLADDTLATEMIPLRTDVDFEQPLRDLLGMLHSSHPDLTATVKVGATEISLSDWLVGLTGYVVENGLSVPVTDAAVECVRILSEISPRNVEPNIGQICCSVLFNIDHVDCAAFFASIVDTYLKLRQVPKLVAKILIALTGDIKVGELSESTSATFARAVVRLPPGQVVDLWKTFLYHISGDRLAKLSKKERQSLTSLCDQMMSIFVRNVAVSDHTVARPIVQKARELLMQTDQALQGKETTFPRVRRSLSRLAKLLAEFRGGDQELKSIYSALEDAPAKADDLHELSALVGDTKKFASLVGSLSGSLDDVAESSSLHAGIVMNVCHFASEVLDVDGGGVCEDAAKHLTKLFASSDLNDEATEKKLKKAFAMLEKAMVGDITNPDLDAKFYFVTPISALESLPLEQVDRVLNLVILNLTILLLTVSSDEEANARLAVILARSLDRSDCQLLKYVDGIRLLQWVASRRGLDATREEQVLRVIARSIVKYVHEHKTKHKEFEANVGRLAAVLSHLQRGYHAAVLLIEELEKPLSHRDASKDKLEVCDRYFDTLSASLLSAVKKGRWDESDSKQSKWVMGAVSAAVSVLFNRPSSGEEDKYKPWSEAVRKSLDHCLDNNTVLCQSSLTFLANIVSAQDSLKLPDDSLNRIWRRLLDVRVKVKQEVIGELLTSMDAEEAKAALRELTADTVATEKEAMLAHHLGIWRRIASISLPQNSDHLKVFREAVDGLMPRLFLMDLRRRRGTVTDDWIEGFLLPMLDLEHALLDRDQPLLSAFSEARCMLTLITADLTQIGNGALFVRTWNLVYRVMSTAMLKRPNSLILDRIPLVLDVFKNLLHGLSKNCDQSVKVPPTKLKELVLCSSNLDRLCSQFRRHKEDFARVAPYPVAQILISFQEFPPVYPAVKSNLLSAIRKLLEICDRHSKDFLGAILPDGVKDLYKQTLEDYNKHYKYSGKV